MKISLNLSKQYLDFALPSLPDLEDHIGSQLGAIEVTEDIGKRYKGVVVAKIISCVDHPNSDHLHVCMIDDGGVVKDVERDEQGHIRVVCGAPNVREGLMVAWLPPGTTVPESADKEPFVLSVREIRGVKSNGMLASARELALGTSHEGILEVDQDAQAGDEFARLYALDDYVIDIENKMFTHRPDCFGELGIAREIAGILHQPFHSPDWYLHARHDALEHRNVLPLAVQNELPDLVPRFIAVALSDIVLQPSPLWLQTYLIRVGIRPISNVVDITNYMMMLTGQPLHAYDYDKVKALSGGVPTLCARYPRPGETLTLLNGKTVTPRAEAIIIATDTHAIGLGGVMGGADTEVDAHTTRIILECATFDMYSIRKTSMAQGLFTDAVTRFNKGQSPLQNDKIVGEALRLMGELAHAKQASDIIDNSYVTGRAWVHPPIPVTAEFINERLGLNLSPEEMKQLLENVEFTVEREGGLLTVIAPFWRTDIEVREDIVEEIGRLYGYDKLPLVLPKRGLTPAPKNAMLDLKSAIRSTLSAAGANEVLTYSFVHGSLLEKVGQNPAHAFRLSNALSPDLQYYRLSLTPNLLDKVHANIKSGFDEFGLFEMGLVHNKDEWEQSSNVPQERSALAFVIAADGKTARQKYAGAAYYEARMYIERLMGVFGTCKQVRFEPLAGADLSTNHWIGQMAAPYEPNRSAVLRDDTGLHWGVVGEFRPAVRRSLKLPEFAAGFEVDPTLFLIDQAARHRYVALPRFPKIIQDICLKVPSTMAYGDVYDFVTRYIADKTRDKTLAAVSPVDIYRREDDKDHTQITLRLTIASYEKTMTDTEVAKLLDEVAQAAANELQAERI